MFGLWFAIYGMLFGSLCSIKASVKNRNTKNWFVLGFVFGIFAFVFLMTLSKVNDTLFNNVENERSDFVFEPVM